MDTKAVIKSQYWAALTMLRDAIEKCPDPLWTDASYSNPFWNIAYHALFFTHLYLQPTRDDFVPWEEHRDEVVGMKESSEAVQPYDKQEVLAYLGLCLAQVEEVVDDLDLAGESGFDWIPFSKLELQFYNIRHLQLHVGELCERLGGHGEIEVGWVGMRE
ncbi:DinB family protein [bacterium]|nr:DinB family protein [bacterium]